MTESIVVIKIGTNVLTDGRGRLDADNIIRLAKESESFTGSGRKVIIVSSGAIGAGCGTMDCSPVNLSISEKQAMASVGQPDLMDAYRQAFDAVGKKVGQILLSASDLTERKSYLNVRNTIFTLLEMGVVPVINENDTVTVDEIKVGDNDRLSAVVASKMGADMLIILTDVDGFMDEKKIVLKEVEKIDDKIESLAGKKGSSYAVGGMITKLEAAKMFSRLCGGSTYIASGRRAGVLKEIAEGANPGTVFKSCSEGLSHRKRWIAHGLKSKGSLVLDDGAVEAVRKKNASLLPVGIKKIKGNFAEGDSVNCLDSSGAIIARGLVNYSSSALNRIKGLNTSDIEGVLGVKNYDEAVHKDNLVLE